MRTTTDVVMMNEVGGVGIKVVLEFNKLLNGIR